MHKQITFDFCSPVRKSNAGWPADGRVFQYAGLGAESVLILPSRGDRKRKPFTQPDRSDVEIPVGEARKNRDRHPSQRVFHRISAVLPEPVLVLSAVSLQCERPGNGHSAVNGSSLLATVIPCARLDT